MNQSIRLDGKVALITGAGGGLGRAHALELASRGASVVVNDLGGAKDGSGSDAGPAESVVSEIVAAGGQAVANTDSVVDREGAKRMVQQAIDTFGRIDILVNNAGILRDKSFAKMDLDDFELVVQVHLMGSVFPTHAAWPYMQDQKFGRIVFTTSSSGLFGNFGQSNYGSAKMAVVGLMNCLKIEGEKDNIRVNCLSPTAWSRMTAELMPAEAAAFFTPELVSPAVVALCTEDAPTGMVIEAGAGYFARVEVQESPGVGLYLDADAELLSEKWQEVNDMTEARPFGAAPEVAMAIARKYNVGL
jgi:NAD(P)-dependent dehydrogenase (short-subunit alcohol dehydrogenase family)